MASLDIPDLCVTLETRDSNKCVQGTSVPRQESMDRYKSLSMFPLGCHLSPSFLHSQACDLMLPPQSLRPQQRRKGKRAWRGKRPLYPLNLKSLNGGGGSPFS